MTSVEEIDRLVIRDDAAVARLWPRLGPRVRQAYTTDRDGWIAIRQRVETGVAPTSATLETQRRVFAGWFRAFGTATSAARKPPSPRPGRVSAPPIAAPVPEPAPPAVAMVTTAPSSGGAGAAVAGGLVLAGFIALAAKRRKP